MWELIVLFALVLPVKAQTAELDTDIALYILYGILGVSALVCLILVICIAWFCWKVWQFRVERRRECSDVNDTGRSKKRTPRSLRLLAGHSRNKHSSLSFPLQANPAYEEFTPPGTQGVSTSSLADSPSKDSLSDLDYEVVESPTTPITPQSFDHTPLLSKRGNTGSPCSSTAMQVESEQKSFNYTTVTPWRDNPNFSLASTSLRSQPRSEEKTHITSVSPTHPHSNTLQPSPVYQNHFEDIGQTQPSPRTKPAQYLGHLAASVVPKSMSRYSPVIARKLLNAPGIKASASNPEQLSVKSLHLDQKETIDRRQQEEDGNEAVTHI